MEILIPAVILAADTLCDLKQKEIFPVATAAGAVLGIMVNVLVYQNGIIMTAASLIPGFLFLAISIISRGQTGAGDALVLFLIGAWTGNGVWRVLLFSLFGAAVFAGVLWAGKRRNIEFPFVPFLMAAFTADRIMTVSGIG